MWLRPTNIPLKTHPEQWVAEFLIIGTPCHERFGHFGIVNTSGHSL